MCFCHYAGCTFDEGAHAYDNPFRDVTLPKETEIFS